MARWLLAGVVVAASALVVSPAARAADPPRLGGTFLMLGKLTSVQNVYGEHRGQRVQRTWFFIPNCATGACRKVTLARRRSGKHILDVVTLKRHRPDLYVGTGHFWIALKCNGQVVQHGGQATEKITVRVTRTQVIGGAPVATGLKATYQNPSRVNLTKCPGGIGHDAATYTGTQTSSLVRPPTAAFTVGTDPSTARASFNDGSSPGATGASIVAWSWNFGDPASASNTSSARNATHQYSAHGTYTVTLQVRDADGQLATTTQPVTV